MVTKCIYKMMTIDLEGTSTGSVWQYGFWLAMVLKDTSIKFSVSMFINSQLIKHCQSEPVEDFILYNDY